MHILSPDFPQRPTAGVLPLNPPPGPHWDPPPPSKALGTARGSRMRRQNLPAAPSNFYAWMPAEQADEWWFSKSAAFVVLFLDIAKKRASVTVTVTTIDGAFLCNTQKRYTKPRLIFTPPPPAFTFGQDDCTPIQCPPPPELDSPFLSVYRHPN
jgi:hypothetical protein